MKTLCMILMAVVMAGCNEFGTSGPSASGTHCYLAAGIYLATGHEWEDSGYVDDAFHTYNTDQGLHLQVFKPMEKQAIEDYLNAGCRVAIQYRNGSGGEHSQPLFESDEIEGLPITFVYVACKHNNTQDTENNADFVIEK